VINKSQVMTSVLARCPGFTPRWEKHKELWQGEEAGLYNDFSEFAVFVVDAYARQDIEPIVAAFNILEEFLVNGDEEVRGAAVFGFLEALKNTASWRPFGETVFIQWLGPKAKEAWAEIDEVWRGKTNLMQVVRAEVAAEKNKPKP
jgi:hypothetical protein